MTLAEKLVSLRRARSMSQEELAERLFISRQAVSKWESGQSVPDIDNIVRLSEIFGVSCDYLLKDSEANPEGQASSDGSDTQGARTVGKKDAEAFLALRRAAARNIALATLLCILSPICLLTVDSAVDTNVLNMSAELATAISLAVLLITVTAAVAIYIYTGVRAAEFEYLEKEAVSLDARVRAEISERKSSFSGTYIKGNVLGACLCILSAVPLLVTALVAEGEYYISYVMLSLSLLLLIVGAGVGCFIYVGVIRASYDRLLSEGDYSINEKARQKRNEAIGSIYWCAITAGYLAYSFITMDWGRSWIIWPVSAVLFGVVEAVMVLLEKNKK